MPLYSTPAFGSFWEGSFLNEEPRAALGRFLEGYRGTPFEDYALNNYSKYYARFLSELARDPTKSFLSSLQEQDPYREFRTMSPSQRGERPQNFVGRVKWVGL